MKRIQIFNILIFFSTTLLSQKYNYQWAYGYGTNLSNRYGLSLIDFNNGAVEFLPFNDLPRFELSNGGSFICNKEGKLVLMTDNCKIWDKNFQVIENSTHLNPGQINDENCPHGVHYPVYQSSMFLPDLSNDSIYYLLHKDFEFLWNIRNASAKNFYLEVIEHQKDGSWKVTDKRKFFEGDLIVNRLTAIAHKNKKQWWTWGLGFNENKFYKYLIGGKDTIKGPYIQEIGPPQTSEDFDIGQTSFSPDGKYLAINNENLGVMLYEFDNETGELSNFRNIEYPDMETCKGLVFSPNSKFVYVSTANHIFQIELETKEVVDLGFSFTADETGWPIGAGMMYLGPDCRIYVSPGSTTYYMHIILYPNQKGKACGYVQNAVKTPSRFLHHIPNQPIYGACDSTIKWTGNTVGAIDIQEKDQTIQLFPNPAQDKIQIKINDSGSAYSLQVYNLMGQVVYEQSRVSFDEFLNVSNWKSGVYVFRFESDDGVVLSMKMVKSE